MYLLFNLNWSEILSSRPVYAAALKTNVYSITSLIPNLLGMTESCALISKWQNFNTQTKILPKVL